MTSRSILRLYKYNFKSRLYNYNKELKSCYYYITNFFFLDISTIKYIGIFIDNLIKNFLNQKKKTEKKHQPDQLMKNLPT